MNENKPYSTYDIYVKDAQRYPLLSRKEEIKLSKIILSEKKPQEEKDEAIKELVQSNLFLVMKFANGYKRRNNSQFPELSLMDLIEEGNLGLLRAAKTFDYKYGKFSTYASLAIKHRLWKAYADNRLIRIPACHSDIIYKVNKLKGQLITQDHTEISAEELAEETGLKEERIKDVMECGKETSCFSLDAPLTENSDGEESLTLIDAYEDPNTVMSSCVVEDNDIRDNLFDRMQEFLNKNEQQVLLMKYFSRDEVTLEDMGNVLGLTRERIRQILAKALRKLRSRMGNSDDLHQQIDFVLDKRRKKNKKLFSDKKERTVLSPISYEECEIMASELRRCILNGEGVTLKEYVKRAKKVEAHVLGYRKTKAIHEEPFLKSFIPDEVLEVLQKRDDLIPKYNESDDEFIRNNHWRGTKWLSERFYTSVRSVSKRANSIGIRFQEPSSWTKEKEDFIRNNADKTARWFADKLNMSPNTIRSKAKRMGIDLTDPNYDPHLFTAEEDNFIKENKDKGSKWLSENMDRSRKSITSRAKKLKIKIPVVLDDGRMIKKYTDKEDGFLRMYLPTQGLDWVVGHMNRSRSSIESRASKLRIKTWHGRLFSAEEDQFIRDNIHKGYAYIARELNITSYTTVKRRVEALCLKR